MSRGRAEGYIEGMRVLRLIAGLSIFPLLVGLPVCASVAPMARYKADVSREIVVPREVDDGLLLRESLRRDVAAHPSDFVVFATEAGAELFVAQHEGDAERETDRRMVARGVVGYWEGKEIVVLPWEPETAHN